MERLTIDGGEVWLGFARNRVKALKKAGVRYTRQVFVMPDGAKVIIELAGKDHTIRLSSGSGSIISGVVQNGVLVKYPPTGAEPGAKPIKKLSKFKATVDAAKKVLRNPKSALGFGDIRALATDPTDKINFADPFQTKSQIGVVSAGMFSGTLRQVVQILLGLKSQPKITYRFYWLDTYGIHKHSDGTFWLIRISYEHGVLAMPLGLTKGSKNSSEAESEVIELFGGIPNGDDFPKDEEIEQNINEAKILRLMTRDKLRQGISGTPFYPECGWSFNADGTEAHNTSYGSQTGSSFTHSFHYKIEIKIEPYNRRIGLKYKGHATTTLVNSYRLESYARSSLEVDKEYPPITCHYRSDDGIQSRPFKNLIIKYYYHPLNDMKDIDPIVILVGHKENGELYKVGYYGVVKEVERAYSIGGAVYTPQRPHEGVLFPWTGGRGKFGKFTPPVIFPVSQGTVRRTSTTVSSGVRVIFPTFKKQIMYNNDGTAGGELWSWDGEETTINMTSTYSGDVGTSVSYLDRPAMYKTDMPGIDWDNPPPIVEEDRSRSKTTLYNIPDIRDSYVVLQQDIRQYRSRGNEVSTGPVLDAWTFSGLPGGTHADMLPESGGGPLGPLNFTYDNSPELIYGYSWYVNYDAGEHFRKRPSHGSCFLVRGGTETSRTDSHNDTIRAPVIDIPSNLTYEIEPKIFHDLVGSNLERLAFDYDGFVAAGVGVHSASLSYFGAKNPTITIVRVAPRKDAKREAYRYKQGKLVKNTKESIDSTEQIDRFFFVGFTGSP